MHSPVAVRAAPRPSAQHHDHPTGICHFSYKHFLNEHNRFSLDRSPFGHALHKGINAQGFSEDAESEQLSPIWAKVFSFSEFFLSARVRINSNDAISRDNRRI
jgi:hypothetical protein